MPWVCRCSRRLISQAPARPTASTEAALIAIGTRAAASSPSMRSTVMPTETSATTLPPSVTGTTARIDGPERAGVLLGEVPALRGAAEVAHERLAQLGRVGVGVAGPVERHHHDEVDVGVGAHLLGVRLEAGARVRLAQPVADGGGVGDGEGHREGPVAGAGAGVPPGVVRREAERDEDQDHDHEDLEAEHLPGDGPLGPAHVGHSAPPRGRARPAVPP